MKILVGMCKNDQYKKPGCNFITTSRAVSICPICKYSLFWRKMKPELLELIKQNDVSQKKKISLNMQWRCIA